MQAASRAVGHNEAVSDCQICRTAPATVTVTPAPGMRSDHVCHACWQDFAAKLDGGPGRDPRWEWIEAGEFGRAELVYVKGRCRHIGEADVHSADGELIARFCLTCDRQVYLGSAAA